MAHAGTRRRTGGRSARVRAAVLGATIDLLIADGPAAATIPAIAARAGVSPSSIYRRWGDRSALLVDALLDAAGAAAPVPMTGGLRDDLIALLSDVRDMLASPLGAAMHELFVSTRDGELRRTFWTRRLDVVTAVVDSAVERRELPAETDRQLLVELLVGPLHTHLLFDRDRLPHAPIDAIVDHVLRGFSQR